MDEKKPERQRSWSCWSDKPCDVCGRPGSALAFRKDARLCEEHSRMELSKELADASALLPLDDLGMLVRAILDHGKGGYILAHGLRRCPCGTWDEDDKGRWTATQMKGLCKRCSDKSDTMTAWLEKECWEEPVKALGCYTIGPPFMPLRPVHRLERAWLHAAIDWRVSVDWNEDEVYEFCSNKESWDQKLGRRGFVLLKQGRPAGKIVNPCAGSYGFDPDERAEATPEAKRMVAQWLASKDGAMDAETISLRPVRPAEWRQGTDGFCRIFGTNGQGPGEGYSVEWNTDEVYKYNTDWASWKALRGREGYVLVKSGRPVEYSISGMN